MDQKRTRYARRVTYGFDVEGGRFSATCVSEKQARGRQDDLPSIVIIAVNVQDFLALDTEDAVQVRRVSSTITQAER